MPYLFYFFYKVLKKYWPSLSQQYISGKNLLLSTLSVQGNKPIMSTAPLHCGPHPLQALSAHLCVLHRGRSESRSPSHPSWFGSSKTPAGGIRDVTLKSVRSHGRPEEQSPSPPPTSPVAGSLQALWCTPFFTLRALNFSKSLLEAEELLSTSFQQDFWPDSTHRSSRLLLGG